MDNGKFEVYSVSPTEFYWCVFGTREEINVEPDKDQVNVVGDGPYRYIL